MVQSSPLVVVLGVSVAGTREADWDRDTWPELEILAKDHPEAGIHFQETVVHGRARDAGTASGDWMAEMHKSEGPWFKDVQPNFKVLSTKDELAGLDSSISFTSVCINTAIYLPYLVSQCLKAGVVFKRGDLKNISEASGLHHAGAKADLIVNATGLSSLKLGGVEDKAMVPIRGQTVLVRNSAKGLMTGSSGADDELCYIMERAAGGGTILGGCYQKGNWDSQADDNLANRIMQRAVEILPALTDGKGFETLDVIRHNVGLRPHREGGTRVEREVIAGTKVVHSYGHGGFGYQSSYGCAKDAVKLVEQSLAG